jgi:hypothetical protein
MEVLDLTLTHLGLLQLQLVQIVVIMQEAVEVAEEMLVIQILQVD